MSMLDVGLLSSAALWRAAAAVAAFIAFAAFAAFLERRAAMRGSHRAPLPAAVDKAIRCCLLACFLAPAALWLDARGAAAAYVLYLPLYLDGSEMSGRRRSAWFVSLGLWHGIRRYFGLRLVNDNGGALLQRDRQYVVALHPHGILPLATMMGLMTDIVGARAVYRGDVVPVVLIGSFLLHIPGVRDILLALGATDASRYNAARWLAAGRSVLLSPGGANEAYYSVPGTQRLLLRRRKGFIRLALESGAALVPVYGFGETECHRQHRTTNAALAAVQRKLNAVTGMALPLLLDLRPRAVDVTVVVGKPIAVRRVAAPTDAQVDALHAKYVAALRRLFDDHAPDCIVDPARRVLEIVE
jgi:hypothetical protein